jgi:hypothetical protein
MAIGARMNSVLASTAFEISAAMVSDSRYPHPATNAAAPKIAAPQVLDQKTTEIQTAAKSAEKHALEP